MAYVSIADPDSAKWEQDLKAGIASGPTKTKQVSWGTITVHTGPFRLASFHKAFDDWFQQEGLLSLFADDGKLLNGKTYGELKNYDKKAHPAIRYALMLWGDQFGKSGPDHAIDESGMAMTAADISKASCSLLSSVVSKLRVLPELLSFADDLLGEDLASLDSIKLQRERCDFTYSARAGANAWTIAFSSFMPSGDDKKSQVGVKAVWTEPSGAAMTSVSDLSKGVGGVALTFSYLGKELESGVVVSWNQARPMSDEQAIRQDLDAAAPDFKRALLGLVAQARKEASGHIGLVNVFKSNMKTYLAKAKELPDFKDNTSWIAVVSWGEARLLAAPSCGGKKLDDAFAVYKIDHPAHFVWHGPDGRMLSTGDKPKTSITSEKLDPDFELIAARGDEDHWTEYGHWHRYHWIDYVVQGASDALLMDLGIDTEPWKKPFGAGTDDNDIESGSFKGGFALRSYRSGECDSGD